MLESIICTGDTLKSAINNGLQQTSKTIDQVEYEIIEEGKSILNVVLKPYRIRLIIKDEAPEKKTEDIPIDPVDAKAEIEISDDQLCGYMTLIPPNGGEMITKEQLYNAIEERKITYGILNGAIDDIIDSSRFNTRVLIAKGDPPIDGIDGEIKYYFDTNFKVEPKILENGNVDFKELNIIKNVNKGEILAEKILPTNGSDGKTIMDRILRAKPGKPVYFKVGKNVIESEDGLQLIAVEDGCPRVIDGKVTVLQVYEINGNVDNSTGNIYFNGKVIVKGNVCTGFKVQCDGDIEVYGVVEGAEIEAAGDIILRKGIQGHNMGKLYSKGNITASYIENAYVNAKGSIHSDVVLHSILESKDSIKVMGRKGMLVGGEVRATMEISANTIGSPMSTVTRLEVGIDPEIKQRYDDLKAELDTLYKNRENVVKAIELLTKLSKVSTLPADKKEILEKSIKTRAYLEDKINTSNSSLIRLQELLQTLSTGKIHAKNFIYPGVKITIGNSSYYVRDNIKYSTVLREDSEIRITEYMKKNGE